jgi:isoleucyl-tRNA synthetase
MVSMKTMMLVLMTFLFGLSFISQPSYAEIYKWVDDKGTVHFTEDPATIPEKYQDNAKSRQTEEDLMSPEEKARARIEHERSLQERIRKEQKAYEKSLAEESLRKKRRELEDNKEEERLKAEKEEKARKTEENKRQQEPEYAEESCFDCNGTGTIWKPTKIAEKDSFGRVRWKEEKLATKCQSCNGKGFILKRIK